MRRFDQAIRAIQNELYREAGRVVLKYNLGNEMQQVEMAARTKNVENLKEAMKILQQHERNKYV